MHARRLERAVPLAALAVATDAAAALFDFDTLAGSPLSGAWGAFVIAVTVVIVLLLWHAIDDERPESRSPQRGRAGNLRGHGERVRDRRAA